MPILLHKRYMGYHLNVFDQRVVLLCEIHQLHYLLTTTKGSRRAGDSDWAIELVVVQSGFTKCFSKRITTFIIIRQR